MKKNIFVILLFAIFLYAGELEVEGNLTVTGDIVSPTIDALRDDGHYEYTIFFVQITTSNPIGDVNQINWDSGWLNVDDISFETQLNPFSTFSNEISTLFNDGWNLDSISGEGKSWWIFKRSIEE